MGVPPPHDGSWLICITSSVYSYHGGSAPPRRFRVDLYNILRLFLPSVDIDGGHCSGSFYFTFLMFERFYTLRMWLVFELWVRVDCWYCISSSVHSYLRSISTAVLASVLSHSISISIFTSSFMNIVGLWFYLTIYRVHIFYRWREIGGITVFDLWFTLSDGVIWRGGHLIKSAVHSYIRYISTAGGGRPMLIAYKINKQT